jgi:diguanylate cyclase (GGDEF)-like protein
LLIVGFIWVGGVRMRRHADARLTGALEQLGTRMDVLSGDLTAAMLRVEEIGRRQRALGDLGSSIDLEDVLARAAEAAALLPGAEASVVHASSHDGSMLVSAVGVPEESAVGALVTGPPDGSMPRAVTFSFEYDAGRAEAEPIRAGLAVPLRGEEEEPLGFLTVYTRSASSLREETLAAVESLALRAAPAVENARRFREARQLADTDALTGLHNRRMFHETLGREVARTQRYDRTLALLVLDLDDFKEVNDRYGHLAGDAVLAEVGERMRAVARSADIPCRIGGEEFAVILPESARAEAENVYQRLADAVSSRPLGNVGTIRFSAGLAELRPDDDALSFFERADRALYEAKRTGKNRAIPDS